MIKITPLLLLSICCSSASSWAYNIETNLGIENKTNVSMVMIIDPANGQKQITEQLPPHSNKVIHIESGDNSWKLYQTAIASFKMKGKNNDKLYIQGQVVNYVWGSEFRTYSYLNAITAAKGLSVNPTYSCNMNDQWNRIFDKNKFVIDGTPDKELQATDLPKEASCKGLISSRLSDSNIYTVTCSDGRNSTFCQQIPIHDGDKVLWPYDNGQVSFNFTNHLPNQQELDTVVGNTYCGSW